MSVFARKEQCSMGIKENPFLANITGSKTRFEGLNRFKFSSRHSISSQVPTIPILTAGNFARIESLHYQTSLRVEVKLPLSKSSPLCHCVNLSFWNSRGFYLIVWACFVLLALFCHSFSLIVKSSRLLGIFEFLQNCL